MYKYCKIIILSLSTIFIFSPLKALPGKNNAKFIWLDKEGKGRQKMVCFRKDFALNQVPTKVDFHLFADSRYHLFVNGTFINFGPVRFFPENPFFDSYDIAPYLKQGKNVIAVKVLSNGMNTFQTPKSMGSFVAWGKIQNQNTPAINFKTPGDWKCKQVVGLDNTAPKMSFALGPVEVYDARLDDPEWNVSKVDLISWQEPAILEKQDNWSELEPRIIPHLTQKEMIPQKLCGQYQLKNNEDIYSFRVNAPDLTRKQFGDNYRAFAYTYIYSPKKQTVEVGRWWGEFWLNGKGPLKSIKDQNIPNRNNSKFDLEKGWNYLFIKYGIVWGCWDFYLAIPASAGLELSPAKTKNSKYIFMTAGPFQQDEENRVRKLKLPFESPNQLPASLSKDWEGQPRGETAGNPAWEVAWSRPGNKVAVDSAKVTNLKAKNTSGTAFVFDMGGKRLGRIFIEYEGPAGSIIDIGFAEALDGQKIRILNRAGLYTGARFISAKGQTRYETFKPYGLRYMQINVKNSGEESFKIKKAGVVSQRYPFDKVGSFECSDPMFNAIWELGWRTLLVCSEDTYTDTPFRERGTYAGDALPQYAITLATSGDSRLLKQTMEHFKIAFGDLLFPEREKKHYIRSNSGGNLGDYPFLTLELLRWYIDYTGDIDFAEKLYPGYKNLCESVIKKKNKMGLIQHSHVFIEWTRIDKDATLTTMQALIARSFDNLARLAALLDKQQDSEKYQNIAKEIQEKTREMCWDNDKGAYRDGFKNSEALQSWYPISSAWPVNFGVASHHQKQQLEEFFRTTLADIGSRNRQRKATPYGGFYILGALYKMGYNDIAEKFIRKYWSPMILKYNDTAWENFGDQGGQGTLSHAWSGGPTYYLSTRILGVRLGFPDPVSYKKVLIAPQVSENIKWARGIVPHPAGKIKVDWQVKGNVLFLNYEGPKNLEYIFKPEGYLRDKKLYLNGSPTKIEHDNQEKQ